MGVFQQVINAYSWFNDKVEANSDARANQYFLMGSFLPTFFICCAYVFTMTYGQRWMRNRQAWDLRRAMVLYNTVMVFWSAYLVYEFLAAGWWSDLSLGCEVVNPSWEGKPARMVRVGYFYYLTKLVEMVDTLFFLLRKRFHLISFLHVFHHAALPASVWFGIKLAPGGSGSLFPLINSFIHVIMYVYYGIAAAGPQYAKYLWWKPFMTLAQMVQFVAFILHNQQFFYQPCEYPFYFNVAIFLYAWLFLILFANYFIHEHFLSKRGKKQDQTKVSTTTTTTKSVTTEMNGHSHVAKSKNNQLEATYETNKNGDSKKRL